MSPESLASWMAWWPTAVEPPQMRIFSLRGVPLVNGLGRLSLMYSAWAAVKLGILGGGLKPHFSVPS